MRKRFTFNFENWWGELDGHFDLFSLKFSYCKLYKFHVCGTFFNFFWAFGIYRKKDFVSSRDENKPTLECQSDTQEKNNVLSEEVWFEFGFDRDGHIVEVSGGKDSTDAFLAKSEYEERAAKDNVTPHEFAKLTNIWYDFNTKKTRFLCSRAFLDQKRMRDQQP